ncbi:MAG: hypothetical protein OES09_13900 [Gammaproteobacteria bacterium]|nr:hypothetical protein [Gammaproteobacteria bacterium]
MSSDNSNADAPANKPNPSRGRASVIIIVVVGFIASFFLSRPLEQNEALSWAVQAEADAQRLGRTFMLLLDHSNGPLQSLATLFNGSGRVAADEFENTITYLKGHRKGAFPDSMGFVTKSQPPSCGSDDGCWMVAYSTDDSGVLRPGSDVSRFGPMAGTIETALANENTLIIGPVFQRATGDQYSYYAVTIRNTRQFGVVVSLIDYQSLVARMIEEWIPHGMQLRLQASFLDGTDMTAPRFIVGAAEPAAEAVRTIEVTADADSATFTMMWDVLPDYYGGAGTRTDDYAMYTGIFATLFIALLLWGRRRRHTS